MGVRGSVVAVLVAGLLLGGMLVTASGAERSARARAGALVATTSAGAQFEVSARGAGDEARRAGAIDGGGLKAGTAEALARTGISGGKASARAYAVARSVDVFGGLVTAWGVRREATDPGSVSSRVSGLRIEGRMIGEVTAAKTYELDGGGGFVFVNRDGIGLRVVLSQARNGFPAGSEVRVAVATASARDAKAAPAATPTPTATATPAPEKTKKKSKRKAKKVKVRKITAEELARLTSAGFAFPVYARADIADDFGGPRQIGPHQGNDVFADFGSPVVAVTSGTVSKVGTLPIAGNRLWVTSDSGDAFFYAHMSSFSPEAVDGARVKPGTVLGFVGNTGDAEPTPPHVHFEIHPGGELTDAVDPHSILQTWQSRSGVPAADTEERPGALVAVRDFIAE